MTSASRVFQSLLGRGPTSDEVGPDTDVQGAFIAAITTPEFRREIVSAAAAGNDLKPILAASAETFAAELAELAPLSESGRTAVSSSRTRLAMLGALMGDRRFRDEIHAAANLDWPAELFMRAPAVDRAVTPETGLTISVLVPVYNTPPDVLEQAINSVLAQTYPNWELCICDDASTSTQTRYVLDRFRGSDSRIKIVRNAVNLHIAGATNVASELATGEFVGFLDHDDLLAPDALECMAAAAVASPMADVLYSDEDKLELDGRFTEPYLKPDWSPEHLASVAYVLHFMIVRKSLFFEVGGLRDAYTGAQDYDLTLRATAAARKVVHVPKVLYHWRKIPGSAAAVVDAKPQALVNAEAAVADFARTQDPRAYIAPGLFTGSFRVNWPVNPDRPVTLLMLTDSVSRIVEGRGEVLLVEHAADSIFAMSSFRNFELVIIDNGKMPHKTRAHLQAWGARVETYSYDPPFNFCDKLNAAFRTVESEDIIILNDDIEVISPDWIEALLAYSRRPYVGAVGARLLYPDGRNQHVGMVMGVNGGCTHVFRNQPSDQIGYCGYSHIIRNYSAVTGAVLATRMSLVRWAGGFDREFAVDYNDVDFCLRLGSMGFRIVYTPFASLHHFEGHTLKRAAPAAAETKRFASRWGALIASDPYYHRGLPRDRTDYAVTSW